MYNRFAEMRRRYLREHRDGIYTGMLLTGKLDEHLKEIGDTAQEMFDRLVAQMKEAEVVTEQLKAENQMEWVGRMNSIRSRAAEVVLSELVYKYPYNEQVMIHAQRPDATACAEYDFWNKKMGRFVRRGSTGIALIDTSGQKPQLRYVFDVADTGEREHSRPVHLWQFRAEHEDAIAATLERSYDVSGSNGIVEQMESAAAQLVKEYWVDNKRDILYNIDDSYLDGYDEFNTEVQFRNAAKASITYMLMSRCGLEPEAYMEPEDFMPVFDFNTPAAVAALGTAVSEISQQVLRQIEVAIRNYERERSQKNDRIDLHEERRLPDSRPEAERGAGEQAPGQVRDAAEDVPSGASSHPLEPDDPVRDAVPAPAGDRRDGAPEAGTDDAGADAVGGRDGSAESQRPIDVGGADEQLQGTGGAGTVRACKGADLRLLPERIRLRGRFWRPGEDWRRLHHRHR